jgi:dGTPase
MITEIVQNSIGKAEIGMSEEAWGYTTKLRTWMFKHVYNDESMAKLEEQKAKKVIRELFYYYCSMLENVCEEEKIIRVVTDYISGMTDRYAVERFKEHFIPMGIKCSAREDYLFKLANSEG